MIVVVFMRVWLSSFCCDVYLCLGDWSIYDRRQEIKLMVVVISMLQNLSQRYCSYNSNIKCVDSIINT